MSEDAAAPAANQEPAPTPPAAPEPTAPKKKEVPKKGCLLVILVGLGLLIIGSFLPDKKGGPADEPVGYTSSTPSSDVSSDGASSTGTPTTTADDGPPASQVMQSFDEFMTMKEGKEIDGKRNRIGQHTSIMIQLIGDDEALASASITVVNDGKKTTANFNALSIARFAQNYLGRKDVDDVVALVREAMSSGESQSDYIGATRVSVTPVTELGMITVNFE